MINWYYLVAESLVLKASRGDRAEPRGPGGMRYKYHQRETVWNTFAEVVVCHGRPEVLEEIDRDPRGRQKRN